MFLIFTETSFVATSVNYISRSANEDRRVFSIDHKVISKFECLREVTSGER
jgi:hypothetical protein